MDGGRVSNTPKVACVCVKRSFAEILPEHKCGRRCSYGIVVQCDLNDATARMERYLERLSGTQTGALKKEAGVSCPDRSRNLPD